MPTSCRFPLCLLLLTVFCPGLLASVVFSPAEVNLGRVRQHSSFERIITFTNTGAKPVSILAVEPDCACTLVVPKKRVLASGESSPVKVVTESRAFLGEVVRHVTVRTSAGNYTLVIRMNVAPLGNWNIAAYPVMFPRSPRAESARMGVRMSWVGDRASPRLLSAKTTATWLKVQLVPVGAKAGHYELQLVRGKGAPAGMLKTTVQILTSSPDRPRLDIPVYAPVVSNLRVIPNPLILPKAQVGAETSVLFRITGWSGQDVPGFRLPRGRIAPTENGQAYQLSLQTDHVGVETRTLQVLEEGKVLLKVPVILHAVP